jgi:hypothetical protein
VTVKRLAAGLVIVLAVSSPAMAAMYVIDNPASRIDNPASKMSNPAAKESNPAAGIYNPAARTNSANPLAPVTPPQPQRPPDAKSANVPANSGGSPQVKPAARESYRFRTAKQYIKAAQRAFVNDDYQRFITISEDAIGRIRTGTLKASSKEKAKLERYRTFGRALLENPNK